MRLAGPIVVGMVVQVGMGFTDSVMAGRLSASDLAASAVGSSIWVPATLFLSGVLMAVNPIVAQYLGAGRKHEIGITLRQAMWLGQILAWMFFFLVRSAEPVLVLMGIEEAIIPLTMGYLNAYSWGIPALAAFYAFRYLNEGLTVTKPGMYFAILGLAFNIGGNYVFMYGKLGIPAMGAVGTGWASALVGLVMFLGIFVYTLSKKEYTQYDLFTDFHLPIPRYFYDLMKIGLPNGISSFMEVTLFAIVALFMGSMGTEVVAAHQIAINFSALTYMIPVGISSAITIRVGYYLGKDDPAKSRTIGFSGIALCVAITSIMALVMVAIPDLITSVYTQDESVRQISISLLYMAAIFQISDGLQVGGSGALRGLKDTQIPMFVNILAYWVIGLPIGWYFGFPGGWGPQGLWVGLIAGLTVAAVLHNIRYKLISRKLLVNS